MKRASAMSSRNRSGTLPSPCIPNYCHGGGTAGYHKGCGSERVPLPSSSIRKHGSGSALLTFRNGRTMPSKWEDAERWIFNPISGEGDIGSPSVLMPHHRRPKSKSGPLGTPTGTGSSYSSASLLLPGSDEGMVRNFTGGSPFLASLLVKERGCYCSASSGRDTSGDEGIGRLSEGGRRSYSSHVDQSMVRSVSGHVWSDMLAESSSSLPSSLDEKIESTKDAATMISPFILRKDAATQRSREGTTSSSPKERPHFSLSSSPTTEELQRHFSKLEVRDVQVDDLVTMSRWSKLHASHGADVDSANIVEWKKKTVEPSPSAWGVADTTKCISKFWREEAKITAWENLQKAKAEAALRKLEMKLERKRSSSMDKILNKLKLAQRKADNMRNAVTACQVDQVTRTGKKAPSFRLTRQMGSLSGCFTCHVF
uniref:Uncharacterized protein At3g61260 n=1 Tax=Anthurium amnicola TaxID=1678845 RepID=A0A1D1Y390_9ARAE